MLLKPANPAHQFTIKNSSSGLERRINRWAADTLSAHARAAPAPPPGADLGPHLALIPLAEALWEDLQDTAQDSPFLTALHSAGFDYVGLGLVVQSLLRHAMSLMLSEGIVNELLVTNSEEANRELTKLHEQLFNRAFLPPPRWSPLTLLTGEPLVASVWRRQTFSAAVETLDREMATNLFKEHMVHIFELVNPNPTVLAPPLASVLEASYTFSRMLHASKSPTGGGGMESSGFYRAYVPEIGSQLDPTKLGTRLSTSSTQRTSLTSSSLRTNQEVLPHRTRSLLSLLPLRTIANTPPTGEPERVGACLFPGLVKVSAVDTAPAPSQSLRIGAQPTIARAKTRETRTLVVRRAQVRFFGFSFEWWRQG